MPKVKPHRTSPSLDMTPMVDLAFLLVTFFMLTTKFSPEEAVVVDTPSSTSELRLPESNVITISVDKDKRVFFGFDSDKAKPKLLDYVAAKRGVSFTPQQRAEFANLQSFGVPVEQLGSFLNVEREQRKSIKQPGIPADSLNNQITDWVVEAQRANREAIGKPAYIAIKGDGNADVPTVRKIIKFLQDKNINRFNLITDLETKPTALK
ncbi:MULTISPECIES: ExbD/TolR family protein [Hymenobacter]|uniref:Biopolymer transporter ExbD n=1 Tax=Hymenobacter jejuensis TaxID=2502781 RepID=A0A5B7ZXL9_9BACT|nr:MULTISPECIES: biopolymer transporter ExbD [Hymenobacter]MBC6991390.1 biopolymer transporter ExbD [Hymenobacter sp. BT491]QDA59728.1 biopolymer transporter ExbD [Hymenobacter jejuensis]